MTSCNVIKDIQYSCQKKMDKMTIGTTQTTTQKTKDGAPRSGELRGARDGKTIPL